MANLLPILYLFYLLCLCQPTGAQTDPPPPTCSFNLTVAYMMAAPDGVVKRIMAFNGQFPGPTLRCTKGHWMRVVVKNELDEPTTIHWHGIEQNLTPFYDGPEMVTQCPIPQGASMEYIYELDQAGTYWYHSHHSYQYVDGLWGLLIVDNPQEVYAYDEELLLALADWHHPPAKTLSELYLSRRLSFPKPDSGLINGHGRAKGHRGDNTLVPIYEVTKCKTYRVRILNAGASANFDLSIDGHRMQVIEVDGVDTVQVAPVDVITVWPAQRYSALIHTNIPEAKIGSLFAIVAQLSSISDEAVAFLRYNDDACDQPPNLRGRSEADEDGEQGRPVRHEMPTAEGVARKESAMKAIRSAARAPGTKITSRTKEAVEDGHQTSSAKETFLNSVFVRSSLLLRSEQLKRKGSELVHLDDRVLIPFQSRDHQGVAPDHFDIEFVLTQSYCDRGGRRRICVNGRPYEVDKERPVLLRMVEGESQKIPPSANPIRVDTFNTVVQLVINNDSPHGNGHGHPWHLHGHTFWVLGRGERSSGPFDRERDETKLNFTHAIRRDVAHAWANSWLVIRFVADNPGAWLLHCHINWHLEAGLGAVLVEAPHKVHQTMKVPPEWLQVCEAGVAV